MLEKGIEHCRVFIEEELSWDIAPMRKFFHGRVIPAFVKAYNEAQDAEHHRVFNKDIVKGFLKAKCLGWLKNDTYEGLRFAKDLDHRPRDINDYLGLMKENKLYAQPLMGKHTADLTPERYWELIHECQAYYLGLFHDMFDVRDKPQKPESDNGRD